MPEGRSRRRHAELLARLAAVKQQQAALKQETTEFLRDPAATEKAEALSALRELRSLTPEVTVLCAQTGAVVERIANANDVAEKMTKEVRRIDILQSRLTATLTQSSQLLKLRNALAGMRRAMQLRKYADAAAFLNELKGIEGMMPLDVADKLRVDTMESDLKTVIESAFADGLRDGDRGQIHTYAPLFQAVGKEYEERGLSMLLLYVKDALMTQLTPMTKGSYSTKELMDQLTTVFNTVAAMAQEYDTLAGQCFARVDGVNRLLQPIYAIGEKTSVVIITAYMKQRSFHDRMTVSKDGTERTPQLSPTARGGAPGSNKSASSAEDEIAVLNEQLNEIAVLIQHTQTYERFMRSRVVSVDDTKHVLPSSSESELGKSVQELAGYYCFFENDLLNKAARKAFQWEELRYASAPASSAPDAEMALYPLSSAIDEIFYVSRNSGLRALATGHADCAAGVLNMINTVLRDALGDTMRSRIRNMAAHVKLDSDSSLLASTTQLRDQMQQQFAKLSKTMGPIQLSGTGGSVGLTGANPGSASATPDVVRKELGPQVVMNSLAATTDYIAQLKGELEHELQQDFDEVPSHLRTCLNGLEDASAELAQLLRASRKKLCMVLEPKLTSFLGALLTPTAKRAVLYELTEQMYTFNEANDPFAHQFVMAMRDLLLSFRPDLSPTNYSALVETLATATVEILERWFYGQHIRFNQLGALQFDKDLRVISAFFTEDCDCRVLFATLTQIATVLNVDAPEDVQDVYGRRGRGGVDWKLSAAQTKEVLSRRVEFSETKINQLRL
ncbi:hypothetical protein Poli38472_006276 [Pythium oligandrum]|uniref:Conserved oligomeric Golgi complex subunit 4 n=1 Tax=Pythium oligandrum TaxID=41045 RepID=A0A8K1CTT6_PYTOL|nr:hypothetical protein Poli38472_006276 [Pythium oligandrum]|eukprot:TMW68808.1 hypothetical protein Poli38472_006276 [Pythium oligandrum]